MRNRVKLGGTHGSLSLDLQMINVLIFEFEAIPVFKKMDASDIS